MNLINYNRISSVEYARQWAYSRNPKYYDFSYMGGDCTNFISQCLVAGGMPMNISQYGWYFHSLNSRSAAFSGVQFLYNFLVNNKSHRGPSAIEVELNQIEAGDIIQLSFDGINFGHSLLVIQPDRNDPLLATHSYDTFGRHLSDYVYARLRALHIVGAYY